MSDLISRAAAIEALKEAFNPSITNFVKAKMAIDNLPSAQSEKRTEERTETHACDLIDRQAAQTELMMKCERYTLAKESHGMGHVEWSSDLISVADAMNAIRWLPPAQPERETAKFIRWMECKKTVNYISYTPHCKCSKCGTEFIIETIKYCYMCGAKMER